MSSNKKSIETRLEVQDGHVYIVTDIFYGSEQIDTFKKDIFEVLDKNEKNEVLKKLAERLNLNKGLSY